MSTARLLSTADTRHLELHGGQWRVVVRVPRRLCSIVGKTVLKRGLKTDSLRVAQAKRWSTLAQLRQTIADAATRDSAEPHDPITAEAIEWKEVLSMIETVSTATGDPGEVEHLALVKNITAARRNEVEQNHGPAKAREFAGIVSGERTPLSSHLDRWIKETPHLARRTHGGHRRAVNRLADFAVTAGYMCTIESFDRRVAGFFYSHLASTGVHPATANKCLSSLSAEPARP